ncbi:hypothetical protein Pcinc_043211 [Petrolisthes cinctipes]|uniref:Uncharacterized protein n=1 Tax=Petrolisthes cinctipes TaxID=88211 RepID=A0AAE1BGU8_PETCI|nr:hypothetical protein Pcinc_043211 [Petrolisthes cinctipes]
MLAGVWVCQQGCGYVSRSGVGTSAGVVWVRQKECGYVSRSGVGTSAGAVWVRQQEWCGYVSSRSGYGSRMSVGFVSSRSGYVSRSVGTSAGGVWVSSAVGVGMAAGVWVRQQEWCGYVSRSGGVGTSAAGAWA